MLKVMEGLHNRVAWYIAGMPYQQYGEGGRERSLIEEALEAAGLWPINEYIWS